MDKENLKTILMLAAVAFAILGLNFLIQKNSNNKKEITQPSPTEKPAEKILSPREVVQKYIDGDMAGAELWGWKVKDSAPDIRQYITYSDGRPTEFILLDVNYLVVVKKYEIISESKEKNENFYYVKVNFGCDKVISFESIGLENEKVIKRDGEGNPALVEAPCHDFFKYYSAEDNQIIKENYSTGFFDPVTNFQTINFQLVKDGQAWKINGPSTQPHISINTLNEFLKEQP